ncbi:MAG: hypothetical protein IKA42_03305 [Clostridia bacterium]|nr:hypothetical protein [Clostridia bacterium]
MKKILAVFLCMIMLFAMSACNGDNGNNDDQANAETKIELTTSNYTQYLDVKSTIKVNDFTLTNIAGAYFVDGNATLTLTVYPKQPVKCYNVKIEYTNKSPINNIGIEMTLQTGPVLLVPADGNLTDEYNIEITTGDIDEVTKRVLVYRHTKEKMIEGIENPFGFYMMAEILSVSGHVVVE